MDESAKRKVLKTGVVTFLDVLGWKGVYDRKGDAISSLTRLVIELGQRAERSQRGRLLNPIEVKSISDTIAIFAYCAEDEISSAIEAHGELSQWLIPASIESEIPMRGATAYGEFELGESIFVGKAIDEAASWHEQSDWMGVHLTPSAEYVFEPHREGSVWRRHTPPNKTRLNWSPHCVDWTRGWRDRVVETKKVKSKFLRLGPIVPEIAGKFSNTLQFIGAMAPKETQQA